MKDANDKSPRPDSSKEVGQGIAAFLSLFSLFLALAIAGYVVFGIIKYQNSSLSERLLTLWQEDLVNLTHAHKLPHGWTSIRDVVVYSGTEKAKAWAKDIKIPVIKNPSGSYRLEVLLLSWEDGATTGAIVQYNLIELKSGEMVWELGRTYILDGPNPNDAPAVSEIAKLSTDRPKPKNPTK